MKKNILVLGLVFLFFWACESPMAPEIEIEKPGALISLSVSPNPIQFQKYGFFTVTLKSLDPPNVRAALSRISFTISFDGSYAPITYSSETYIIPAYGFIDVGNRIILAGGKLDISCKLWVPYSSSPVKVRIYIDVRDENGNQIEIWDEIKAIIG